MVTYSQKLKKYLVDTILDITTQIKDPESSFLEICVRLENSEYAYLCSYYPVNKISQPITIRGKLGTLKELIQYCCENPVYIYPIFCTHLIVGFLDIDELTDEVFNHINNQNDSISFTYIYEAPESTSEAVPS